MLPLLLIFRVHSPGENVLGLELPEPHQKSTCSALVTHVSGCITLGLLGSHAAIPVMVESSLSFFIYKLLTP